MDLLRITCSYLEIADRRMTTTVTLVLAHAFVPGSTSLVRPLMSHRVFHRGAFPQRGPSTLRLHLGAQLLLEQFVLAELRLLPARTWLGYTGHARHMVTRRSRQLGLLAWDHGDGWPPGQVTCIPVKSNVKSCLVKSGPTVAQGAR